MDRKKLKAELIRDEGMVLHAYLDSLGYTTIGVGRLIDKRAGGQISKAEAEMLLANDITRIEGLLTVHAPWWQKLDDVRQRVLVNMAFNLGVMGLMGFHDTLEAIQGQDWNAAARHMLDSRWARQVGARATRLAAMMRTGLTEP